MVKSHVSITVSGKHGKIHAIIRTPSHTPSRTVWTIYSSIKKAISVGLFYKRNRKHFPHVPHVIETRVEVWGDSKLPETLALRARVPTTISRFPKLPLVFL